MSIKINGTVIGKNIIFGKPSGGGTITYQTTIESPVSAHMFGNYVDSDNPTKVIASSSSYHENLWGTAFIIDATTDLTYSVTNDKTDRYGFGAGSDISTGHIVIRGESGYVELSSLSGNTAGAKIVLTPPEPDESFGSHVKVSDSYVVVSSNNGIYYVYDLTGTYLRTVTAPEESMIDRGFDLSGNLLITQHWQESNNTAVYVYDVSNGQPVSTLYSPVHGDPEGWSGDFGYTTAISGNMALVAAPFKDAGVVYVFNVLTGALINTIPMPPEYGEVGEFGISLALVGDYAAINAPACPNNVDNDTYGRVFVYNITSNTLYGVFDNNANSERIQNSIAISNKKVYSTFNDFNTGNRSLVVYNIVD